MHSRLMRLFAGGLLGVALVLGGAGCNRQTGAAGELEKAAAALAKADEAAPQESKGEATSPSKQVEEALADYKAGKMEDAVTRLQLLRATPTMSPQQRMALQDSVAAVMREIYELAEQGDKRAIAAKARYEQLQTAR